MTTSELEKAHEIEMLWKKVCLDHNINASFSHRMCVKLGFLHAIEVLEDLSKIYANHDFFSPAIFVLKAYAGVK